MSNYKRKKPRKQVRCSMCTDGRHGNSLSQWSVGNGNERLRKVKFLDIEKEQMKEVEGNE